jgi:alcohol dehydrogenase class IV
LGVRNLNNALIRLRQELELPQTLCQAGVNPGEVHRKARAIVEATLADPCCKTNPVLVEDFMVRRILERVTGRV